MGRGYCDGSVDPLVLAASGSALAARAWEIWKAWGMRNDSRGGGDRLIAPKDLIGVADVLLWVVVARGVFAEGAHRGLTE